MSIQSDKMVFYYMARDNLCFLTLCEDSYPKRLAFLYLEEVADAILQELIQEFGADVSRRKGGFLGSACDDSSIMLGGRVTNLEYFLPYRQPLGQGHIWTHFFTVPRLS